MSKISIIIPVYNAEKTIDKCVYSLTRQSHRDLEVILVNDCSPDNSDLVCKRLADKDSRIKLHKTDHNLGVEGARLFGLTKATGDYIMFVDCDDWLDGEDILEKMISKAKETDADYVETGVSRVLDKYGIFKRESGRTLTGLISQPQLFDDYFVSYFGINILSVNLWGKLYKRELFSKIELKPHGMKMCDDLLLNLLLFPHLKKIYLMPEIGYCYRFGGLTSHYNPYFFDEHLELLRLKLKIIEDYSYQKALIPTLTEWKNILKTDICQGIRFLGSKDKVKDLINQRLSLQEWDLLKNLPEDRLNDTFVKAIKDKDVDTLYEYCAAIEKKETPKYWAKRILSKIISIF